MMYIDKLREEREYMREELRDEVQQETQKNTLVSSIKNIMKNAKVDAIKAMDLLGIPKAEQAMYKSLLQNEG